MSWLKCTGKGKRIAIIDSGIDIERNEFKNVKITLLNECVDLIGHGTAVAAIIAKMVQDATLFCYSLFENDGNVDTADLIRILKNITSNHFFDVIHLSCGVIDSQISELREVCEQITKTGTIIVSAFDNEGVLSYPAMFDNVIGVDWNRYCSDGMEYYYVDNSPVNIFGLGALQYLPWVNGSYRYVAGASFAAPYITGIVVKMLESGIRPNDISQELRNNAQKVIRIDNSNYHPANQEIKIKKAVLFPYNKEIQTLLAYEDILTFDVEGIYDFPVFRNVGKRCKDIINYGYSEKIIESYKDINWNNDFDTFILGHVDVISRILKKDIMEEVLRKCIKYCKNIYAFDDLRPYDEFTKEITDNGNFAIFPKTDNMEVNKTLLGKMYGISTPVVGIFGTSSKQGKFSLQLTLRKKLIQLGYRVGGLGTEPTSLLLGLDRVYPIGYESVSLVGTEAVQTINRYMHEIEEKQYDIIITGSQSHTIPYNIGNSAHYPLAQHEFLIGTNPDAIILCINPSDDREYILRTVNYLESYIYSKVIALVLYPKHRELEWAIQGANSRRLSKEVLDARKEYYGKTIGIPCYVAGNDEDEKQLVEIIISFFSVG